MKLNNQSNQWVMVNGTNITDARVALQVGDMGLLYGFSLFETMLINVGHPIFLSLHLDRLLGSASALGLTLRYNKEELAAMCCDSVVKSGISEGVLRLTVTAGSGGDGVDAAGEVLLTVKAGVPYLPAQYEKGFTLTILNFPRNEKSPLARFKTGNYLENIIGRRQARAMGYDEGLFLNTRGQVAEGAVSNIFALIDNQLVTPPVEAGLLPGVVRGLVMEQLAGMLGGCKEINLTIHDLGRAEEIFVTNSLMGIMPVVDIDNRPVGNGQPGSTTQKIMEGYELSVSGQCLVRSCLGICK